MKYSCNNYRNLAVACAAALWLEGPARADGIYRLDIPSYTINNKADGTMGLTMGSSYSLHAGAIAGNDRSIMDSPTPQPAAATNIFPTVLTSTLTNGRTDYFASPTRLNGGKESTKGTPVPYKTISPKGYDDGVIKTSGAAVAVVGNPLVGNAKATVASAEASVLFTTLVAKNNLTGKVNTWYQATPQASDFSIARVQNDASPARIGTTILDPNTFGSVAPHDQIVGGLSLTKAGFSVGMNEVGMIGATHVEGGSDFPVSTSQTGLGLDYQGLPLIYTLDISFQSGNLLNPSIAFNFNPNYQFFNPDTDSPLSPGMIAAFVAQRIDSNLTLSDPNTVTLDTASLDLIDYVGTAVSTQPSTSVDTNWAQDLEVVPEPPSLVLLGLGMLGALIYLGHRRGRRKLSPASDS